MKRIPLMMILGMLFVSLASCAGVRDDAHDTYVDHNGKETPIESDRTQCIGSCNQTYTTCMESYGAQNSGVNGPQGMFGASADCRSNLKDCLSDCRTR